MEQDDQTLRAFEKLIEQIHIAQLAIKSVIDSCPNGNVDLGAIRDHLREAYIEALPVVSDARRAMKPTSDQAQLH